ncbi:MAG TPA: Fpg/Nei family DNA glycosylase [Chloroflexi bacterium]|jgi:formamidopyrimidine-DNA glycosylase|nr:Fpg/Nei family DNA glycosylase [Chloroflexota bacterium]
MPELPDLEVIKDVLVRRLVGRRIAEVVVLRPLVVRVLDPDATPESFLVGRTVTEVARCAKFLRFALDDGGWMAINAMLAGRLRYTPAAQRARVRDYVRLRFDDGATLSYHDAKGMGKVYLTRDLDAVPAYRDTVPDALSSDLTAEAFVERLRPFRGEIKGILTRGEAVGGIGNAYGDEILFEAGIYPFRKRSTLSREEQLRLYDAMRAVLVWAIEVLRERVGDRIDVEVRDFLRVHNKAGHPCPRCGRPISEITVAKRATSFCRSCQPGSLIRN